MWVSEESLRLRRMKWERMKERSIVTKLGLENENA
ncbi:hypothetical protein L195_g063566, partial [Trifolium pratense]